MSVPRTQIEKPFFTERGPTLILLFESYLVLATALLLLLVSDWTTATDRYWLLLPALAATDLDLYDM